MLSTPAIERQSETLSLHPKLWAASVTGMPTSSLSYLPQTQVHCFSVLSLHYLFLYFWSLPYVHLIVACELLVPSLPEAAHVERGYITPQQVYNLLNAEDGQPALFDPYYILILDCRSAERLVHNIKLFGFVFFILSLHS